jgi:hypothetical protein
MSLMVPGTSDYVGLDAFSVDGEKVGTIKEVIHDPEKDSECLVIAYGLFRDLIVPLDVVERRGERITVPFSRSFLAGPLPVTPKDAAASNDSVRLDCSR